MNAAQHATTVTAVDGILDAINPSGTIAVGIRGGLAGTPAYWYRTTTGTWNPAGVALPTLGGICGEAHGVNMGPIVRFVNTNNLSRPTDPPASRLAAPKMPG